MAAPLEKISGKPLARTFPGLRHLSMRYTLRVPDCSYGSRPIGSQSRWEGDTP